MSNINKIKVSGTTYNIQDLNATKTVELTQAEYDALSVKDQNVFYIITDAQGADLSNYYTKTETDNAITAATSTKQDTLVSGTNIKTINGETLLGEGNITIQGGGGKTIEAGRGISITTGETADTVSFNLPISAGTYSFHNSIRIGNTNNTASGSRSFAGGEGCTASSTDSFAFGLANTASSTGATAFGFKTKADVNSSFVCGKWNDIANANTGENFGDSGNTLFAVGNGWKQNDWTSGTANTHNAIDIRQNGDIYIADTNDTSTTNYYEKPMIKLQDALGGGGTVDTEITSTSTNPVTSAAIYNQFGGLKLVKLTQSEYNSLATKDNSTLYVIVN